MKIIKVDNKENEISFSVGLEKATWLKMQDRAFKKLAKTVKIPGGFRPGTPAHLQKAKAYINKAEIIDRALSSEISGINNFLLVQKEFLDLEEDILNEQPSLKVDKVDDNTLELTFTYKKIPKVTLGDYKKINITMDDGITEKEIKAEIEKYLKDHSELVPKANKKIEKGDFVIFDFDGFVDGVKLDNASSKNYELEIGSNQFIPGFEEKMIGLELGKEAELNLKFPDDYHSKHIAGKAALFKVKINDIKQKIAPKFDELFIKNLKLDKVNTISDFKKYLENKLKENKKSYGEDQAKRKLFEELSKITKLSHDDNYSINQEKEAIEREYKRMVAQSGVDLETFIKMMGQTKEQFENSIRKQAIENVKIKYAIIEISELEKIDITEKEMNDYLEEIAKAEKIKLEEVKEKVKSSIDLLKEKLIFNKTIDHLLKIATKGK
ncbi:MAG: trigger factor [Mycoplasmoidaceae bacterium]